MCREAAEFIMFNTKFLVFNTQFLVFDKRFPVLNANFIIFTHVPRGANGERCAGGNLSLSAQVPATERDLSIAGMCLHSRQHLTRTPTDRSSPAEGALLLRLRCPSRQGHRCRARRSRTCNQREVYQSPACIYTADSI